MKRLLISLGILVTATVSAHNHLVRVCANTALRHEHAQFVDNILRQAPSEKFFNLVDDITLRNDITNDDVLYEHLLSRGSEIKSRIPVIMQYRALTHQKKILGDQAGSLLKGYEKINGYVEIGAPATYCSAIKKHVPIEGTIYAMNDKQRTTDYVQAWSMRKGLIAYDTFVPLNDYAPIAESAIASESVDLVVCLIGLHHIPVEKLDAFVASIYRIIRPGGTFILRDHDTINDDIMSLVHAAHSTYNALMTSETLEDEKAEYRNFQPLQHWIDLLARQGFAIGTERLTQEGDPTRNTMIACTKPARTMQEVLSAVKKRKGHERDIIQTYLTSTEWYNVDAAQEYGNSLDHTPYYGFPYYKNIKTYWRIFGQTWKLAAQKKGHLRVLFSEYTLMNLFVGTTMTLEYAAKSLLSFPVRWMYDGNVPSTLEGLIYDPNNEVGLYNQIKVLQEYPETNMKVVQFPRYKEFLKLMLSINTQQMNIVQISGQEEIQFKVRYKKELTTAAIENIVACKHEFDWEVPTQQQYIYSSLTVKIPHMLSVIKALQERSVEILYIHDF